MPHIEITLDGGNLTDSEMESLLETGSRDSAGSSPANQPEQEQFVTNPLTGCLVNLDDIDSLILECDEVKKQMQDLRAFDQLLREVAWKKTAGNTKTRRLRGKKYQAKVEQGPRYPVGSILKEAYNSYPQYRDKFLRIDSVKLQMREYAKLEGMASDDPAFDNFKGMLQKAMENGSEGLATVSLEGQVTV
jgi:hypothetical protein